MTQIFKKTLLTSLVLFLMTACSDDKKELKIIVEPTPSILNKREVAGNSVSHPINQPLSKVRKHGAK